MKMNELYNVRISISGFLRFHGKVTKLFSNMQADGKQVFFSPIARSSGYLLQRVCCLFSSRFAVCQRAVA